MFTKNIPSGNLYHDMFTMTNRQSWQIYKTYRQFHNFGIFRGQINFDWDVWYGIGNI
jgi:hypothetical protein